MSKAGVLPITGGCVVRPAQAVLRPPPSPFRLAAHFPALTGYRAPRSDTISQGAGPGRASPVPVATFQTFHAPYAGRFLEAAAQRAFRIFTSSMAFALNCRARLLHYPLTTRQASLDAADRLVAPPDRALDVGLRRGPFPVRAADLLTGLLTVTRAGLAPAGNDEHVSRPVTSSRHPPFDFGTHQPHRISQSHFQIQDTRGHVRRGITRARGRRQRSERGLRRPRARDAAVRSAPGG